jgi:phage-related protein
MPYPTHPDITFSQQGSGQPTKYRFRETEFGGGYRQRTVSDINPLDEMWTLSLDRIRVADVDTLVAFLDGRQGLPFAWTPPGEATVKLWTADERGRTDMGSQHETLTVQYRRWYGADE